MSFMTVLVMAIGAWLPYSSFAAAIGLVPLPPVYWAWIAFFLFSYATLTHLVKTWFFKRYGGD